MKTPMSVDRAGSSFRLASSRRHSSLTRGLSFGAIRIFAISADATGFGWWTNRRQGKRLSWMTRVLEPQHGLVEE